MTDLGELGLSSYEAKVYRALLGLGPASATEISTASDVPTGRIYDVLNGLAGRDLVTMREGREPTQYVAVDPAEAADVLLAERTRDLETQRERYEDLAASVRDDLSPVVPAEGRFWPAPLGSDAAISLIDRQFAIAEDRILTVVSLPYADVDVERYYREIEAIDERIDGTLDIRVLFADRLFERFPEALHAALLAQPDSVRSRAASDLHISIDVIDGESVFVHVPDPFSGDDRVGVIGVRDTGFAERIETAFDEAWESARTLDE